MMEGSDLAFNDAGLQQHLPEVVDAVEAYERAIVQNDYRQAKEEMGIVLEDISFGDVVMCWHDRFSWRVS
jgi:hypothetical protein